MTKAFEYCEYVGISTTGIEDAIGNAVESAKSKCSIAWFEVISTRGRITQENKIEYQVTVKFGCK